MKISYRAHVSLKTKRRLANESETSEPQVLLVSLRCHVTASLLGERSRCSYASTPALFVQNTGLSLPAPAKSVLPVGRMQVPNGLAKSSSWALSRGNAQKKGVGNETEA
ncbi:MAG: hypothetical protein AB3N15_12680 [Paracoccaceae bacterium]